MASKAGNSKNENLEYRLAIDVASATVGATLVTPIVAIMDRSVTNIRIIAQVMVFTYLSQNGRGEILYKQPSPGKLQKTPV